jgi:DNA-binding YbaB/EbfC family protein
MLNIQGLMKQAQQMQQKMKETQDRLGAQEREGISGNGAVKIVLNGRQEMLSIKIDKAAIGDDFEMLEDLIAVAYNNAHVQVEEMMAEGMKEATGGVGLGGLKLPF